MLRFYPDLTISNIKQAMVFSGTTLDRMAENLRKLVCRTDKDRRRARWLRLAYRCARNKQFLRIDLDQARPPACANRSTVSPTTDAPLLTMEVMHAHLHLTDQLHSEGCRDDQGRPKRLEAASNASAMRGRVKAFYLVTASMMRCPSLSPNDEVSQSSPGTAALDLYGRKLVGRFQRATTRR
jgi:hypothetical protein